ncbi:MAG TPA: hypothetical protein VH414_07315 [Lichenihabitans sp.]|jgi:hypothetical protein|nr:hypothetical protein [Lichenihabitans sp.]
MISFTLSPMPLDNGQIDVVLRLYRRGKLASVTNVATVHRSVASMVMLRCRVHLRNLGVGEATELRTAG